MKRLNDYRMRLVLVGFVAGIVFGGVRAEADFVFGKPVNLGPTVNTSRADMPGYISADGLELYIFSNRQGTLGSFDIWVLTRTTREDDWEAPVNLGPGVNRSVRECTTCVSADGLELYFDAFRRAGGYGEWDIWVSRRQTRNDPWGNAVNLGLPFNSSSWDDSPSLSSDGLEFYFCSGRPGGQGHDDLWVAKRATKNDPWGEPVNLGAIVNSSAPDCGVKISSDSLLLFFSGDIFSPYRSGGFGQSDIWMSRRIIENDQWTEPLNLGSLINSSSEDCGPVISHDGDTLYFGSNRPGGSGDFDIYEAPVIPIVDLNADGIVDAADMCIMVDHWGENYSLCDIGPTPFGDGVVDVQDLIVLSEHLFEEVDDPTLMAHWPLDEAEGMVVDDGARGNDGYALGDPVWLHDGGHVNGALQLDGVDDYVVTGAAPNPEGNSYSVLAWIKGGAPGQVVLSQMGKADWLCANPSAGTLMTELTMAGRDGRSLDSEVIITDGNWHRIGFVWDGSYRRLYVDGVVVAEDEQDNLDISVNGLYFGTGKAMEPGTFFSGLIDDVRIYNRAVNP